MQNRYPEMSESFRASTVELERLNRHLSSSTHKETTQFQLLNSRVYFLSIHRAVELWRARENIAGNRSRLNETVSLLQSFVKFSEGFLGNHIHMAKCYKESADFLLENQRYHEADNVYAKSYEVYTLNEYRTLEKDVEFAMMLRNWGSTKCKLGNNQLGLKYFEQSLAIIHKCPHSSSKVAYKAHYSTANFFYEQYVDCGLTAVKIAAEHGLLNQERYKREVDNLMGPSLINGFLKGARKERLLDMRFRRSMCMLPKCKNSPCSFAHYERELRN